jgi:hypothetical protein
MESEAYPFCQICNGDALTIQQHFRFLPTVFAALADIGSVMNKPMRGRWVMASSLTDPVSNARFPFS